MHFGMNGLGLNFFGGCLRSGTVLKKADSEFPESAFAVVERRRYASRIRIWMVAASCYFKVTISNMGRASSQVRLLLA